MNIQLLPEIAANPTLARKTWLKWARSAVGCARRALANRDFARATRHLAMAVEYRDAARAV